MRGPSRNYLEGFYFRTNVIYFVLVSLLLTLNSFHTLFCFFHFVHEQVNAGRETVAHDSMREQLPLVLLFL